MCRYLGRQVPSIVAAAAVLSAVIIGACSSGTVAPPGKELSDVDVIHSTMAYIREHHADAAAFIKDGTAYSVAATSGRQLGYSWVSYSGGGWTVTIGRPTVPEPILDIKAEYGDGRIIWTGREKGGVLTELSYNSAG